MKLGIAIVLPLLLVACGSSTAPEPSLLPLLSVDGALYINGGHAASPDHLIGEEIGVVEERIHCSDVVEYGKPDPCPDPQPGTRIWSNNLPVGTPIYSIQGFDAGRALGAVEGGILRLAWTTATVRVGTDPYLAIGEEATVGDLTIRFIEVAEDSRCPTGPGDCVWEGNARVLLDVVHEGITSAVELNSSMGSRTAEVGGYVLDMLRLDPYPDQNTAGGIPPEDYRLSLQVSRPAA